MRFWREIVADRGSGGALCVLLALCFVLQLGLAGRAAAVMAAPDPTGVICSSSPDGSHRPSEPERRHGCPCAELCGAGAHMPASLSPAIDTGIPIQFADRVEIPVDHATPIPAGPFVRQHSARGPPAVST